MTITILNVDRLCYQITRVDGCIITNQLAADYVFTRKDIGDVIVELKGRSVEHAYKQIKATAIYWLDKRLRCGDMAAVIVCRQYPKLGTKRQLAELEFKRICNGRLRVIGSGKELKFEELFGRR